MSNNDSICASIRKKNRRNKIKMEEDMNQDSHSSNTHLSLEFYVIIMRRRSYNFKHSRLHLFFMQSPFLSVL